MLLSASQMTYWNVIYLENSYSSCSGWSYFPFWMLYTYMKLVVSVITESYYNPFCKQYYWMPQTVYYNPNNSKSVKFMWKLDTCAHSALAKATFIQEQKRKFTWQKPCYCSNNRSAYNCYAVSKTMRWYAAAAPQWLTGGT